MNVSAILVTRGDVALDEILDSIPSDVEVLVWDNGSKKCHVHRPESWLGGEQLAWDGKPMNFPNITYGGDDLAVYGRYAAIQYASGNLIYVQDDDVLHTPEGIEEICWQSDSGGSEYGRLVCNMPANFRHSFYQEHALVGFGACFHRDLPAKAFERFCASQYPAYLTGGSWSPDRVARGGAPGSSFSRTCDIVFTALTPRVLVDVPYQDLPWASAPNRMWQQSTHRKERGDMLDLVLKVRDGTATSVS